MPPMLYYTQHYIGTDYRVYYIISMEGVAPSPTPWCSSYRKGSLRVTRDYGRQLYLLTYIKLYYIILYYIMLYYK